MTAWALLGVLVGLVLIAVALDPWLAPEDPPAKQRRAWYKRRLAVRRGEPDDAQLERWFAEDR